MEGFRGRESGMLPSDVVKSTKQLRLDRYLPGYLLLHLDVRTVKIPKGLSPMLETLGFLLHHPSPLFRPSCGWGFAFSKVPRGYILYISKEQIYGVFWRLAFR